MRRVPTSSPDNKFCPRCKLEKPLDQFYRLNQPKRKRTGPSSHCKPCHRDRNNKAAYWKKRTKERQREIYRKRRTNPENVEKDREWNRQSYRRKMYGITSEDFRRMNTAQGGRCAICQSEPKLRNFHDNVLQVDHDHATGQVRGLLCWQCNNGLGQFRDSPDLLRIAIDYLIKHR